MRFALLVVCAGIFVACTLAVLPVPTGGLAGGPSIPGNEDQGSGGSFFAGSICSPVDAGDASDCGGAAGDAGDP